MSIFEETGGARPTVAHDRSLELFCDRYELIAHFLSLINEDPPPRRLLYLYGLGGNGKSLLLRYFEARCCVRLPKDEWARLRQLPTAELPAAVGAAPKASQVPVARVDFGARPAGENRPQECFSALFMLKRQLARYRIATPRFDFAAVTYLHKLGLDLDRRLAGLFPRNELAVAIDLADALLPIQLMRVGQGLFEVLDKRLDEVLTRRRMRRRLPSQDAHDILSMAPEPDLIQHLPRYFAADLRGAVAGKARLRRIVLLLDTHEAFFGEAIADADALVHADYLMRDEWVRSLLGHLPLEAGIVAVVAGRNRPPWAQAPVAAIPDAFVRAWPVGQLTIGDALAYLDKAGVSGQRLRQALTSYAQVAPGEIHPYFLGLCADVALAARDRGGQLDPESFADSQELTVKERELARRLLMWVPPEVEYGILAVSGCRSFTYRTFSYLGDKMGFPHQRSDFARLVAFSFISPTSGGVGGDDRSHEDGFKMHRVARADIGLGRWAEAEALLDALPAGSPHETLLRAEIAFVRGEFGQAEELARAALTKATGPTRAGFLFRLAEIELYLGRFADARQHARDGLEMASAAADRIRICRWNNLLGEIEYFSGNVDTAASLVAAALDDLQQMPEHEQDQVLLAGLLQNAALTSEASGNWQTALERQQQALRIRQGAEDARGTAQSLHGIGKACCGLGRLDDAEHALAEAAQAAGDLGEQLLAAKISHALADTRVVQRRLDDAARLATEALAGFQRHGTPYDVASARLTLARIARQQGHFAAAMTGTDAARAAIESGGYRVLYRLFPDQEVPPAARIHAGMAAFAAGDALGGPWEGRPPHQIDPGEVASIPVHNGWPRGATSDDTAQMLLVASHLVATSGEPDARRFLGELSRALPAMRGAGPTTRAAVTRYQGSGEIYATTGDTNGALMRILPAGWAIPATHAAQRRDVVARLTRVTHGAPVAIAAACAVAAMASYAVEGCPARELITVALGELGHVLGEHPAAAVLYQTVAAAAGGSWRPGPAGVSLDAAETLAAVVHVLAERGDDLDGALRYAVSLGGDTDTVAAITAGILGCRSADLAIGWLDRVLLPDAAELDRLGTGLRELRRAAYG